MLEPVNRSAGEIRLIKAIDLFLSHRSRSRDATRVGLETIREHIEMLLDALDIDDRADQRASKEEE